VTKRPQDPPAEHDWDPEARANEPQDRAPRDPERGNLAPESARERQNEGREESGGGAGRPDPRQR
jgi:hypothetical protein